MPPFLSEFVLIQLLIRPVHHREHGILFWLCILPSILLLLALDIRVGLLDPGFEFCFRLEVRFGKDKVEEVIRSQKGALEEDVAVYLKGGDLFGKLRVSLFPKDGTGHTFSALWVFCISCNLLPCSFRFSL